MATPAEVISTNKSLSQELTIGGRVSAYVELTKPRITFMVVLSSLAGFFMASKGNVDWVKFLHLALGVSMLTSGTSTLNQYWERDSDKLMRRTMRRPLPSGKMSPLAALLFGTVMAAIGEVYLVLMVNPLTAVIGFMALASYVLLYTPLKQKTVWCTFLGAFPGALPPLLGWAGASDEIALGGIIMFAILFLWQFPHFHAIAMMYTEDYARAGIKMLPVVEPDCKSTARQIIAYAAVLFPVSLLPYFMGMSGLIYLVSAAILGAEFLYISINTARTKTKIDARKLLKASVMYLPLLYLLMTVNS